MTNQTQIIASDILGRRVYFTVISGDKTLFVDNRVF